jgi:hypothetical protein
MLAGEGAQVSERNQFVGEIALHGAALGLGAEERFVERDGAGVEFARGGRAGEIANGVVDFKKIGICEAMDVVETALRAVRLN